MINLFWKKKKNAKLGKEDVEDVVLVFKSDRRCLSKVPDPEGVRSNLDRRGSTDDSGHGSIEELIYKEKKGKRYVVDYDVVVKCMLPQKKAITFHARCTDISTTGMLLEVLPENAAQLKLAVKINLKFAIEQGSMPEGYEMSVNNIGAKHVHSSKETHGKTLCGLVFLKTLAQYAAMKKDWYMLSMSSLFLFFALFCVFLLRTESVFYFKFNKTLYAYSIVAATFLVTRYLFGALYRPVPIDKDFEPGVSIVIPCFNEEKLIQRTISSCINQDYPINKLEVIVVDDHSNDQSLLKIKELAEELKATESRFDIENRLHFIHLAENRGKREALAKGTLKAKHDLVVFVDSDSFLDPYAIRNIIQPFQDDKIGAVCGRTDVANTYTNALTKMQAVRYYISFRIVKAAESYFDAVTCLSGPLSCYRRQLVMENMEEWLNQKFLGQRATFGDDRSMTNFILRKNRTYYQDTAVCSTIVPSLHKIFLRQQMRWKRSWLRESIIASGFMWKKEPFMALSFYMGVLVPFLAPVIVIYNMIYIPIAHRVFPVTFIIGMSLMALLMSMAQLFLRKSSTWIYGLWFCLYYEAVLLWQMPIAWFTFWETKWGTRMTPADVGKLLKQDAQKQQGA